MTHDVSNPTLVDPAAVPAPTSASAALRRAALVAGAAIMLVAALAGFGNLVVVQGLVTPGDAATTSRDILGSEANAGTAH